MVKQLLNSLLFYFFSDVIKGLRPAEFSAIRNLLGSFSLLFGDTLVLQMGDTVGPRYTAPKISAISYLFRTFSLLIMGDTERPRHTGFRGLSVCGITALQCMMNVFQLSVLYSNDFHEPKYTRSGRVLELSCIIVCILDTYLPHVNICNIFMQSINIKFIVNVSHNDVRFSIQLFTLLHSIGLKS